MKKSIFIFVPLLYIGTIVLANSPKVDNYIQYKFNKTFVHVTNLTWKSAPQFLKAKFEKDGIPMEAFFDNQGNLLATSKMIDFALLPENAKKFIGKAYPILSYRVMGTLQITNEDGDTKTYVNIESIEKQVILEVDPSGNVEVFRLLLK